MPEWPEIPEAGDDLDRMIEAYFVDQRILAAENARRRTDRAPAPAALIGYDGQLFDWLVMMLNYGPPDGPERAWPIVLDLIERAPDENSLTFTGAGAVEDLVNKSGPQFVDRIVDRAAVDPRFRRALCHIWYHPTVPEALKELIESARASADG